MRLALRALVSGLLATSGMLQLTAASQRWWPTCKLGSFDEPACVRVQNDDYGYLVPNAPWVPVGDAAQLAGIALVCLAVAVVVLPWLWCPRHRGVALAVMVPATAIALMGLTTWAAGVSGMPVSDNRSWLPLAAMLWAFGLPALLVTAAVAGIGTARPGVTRWRLLTALLVGSSNPLSDFLIGSMVLGYVSHDSTPWVEGVSAAFLVSASIVVWPSTRAPAPGATDVPKRRRDEQHATTT